jgi:hypothetical protein
MRYLRAVHVSHAIMLLNTLLFLAGFVAFRWAAAESGTGHWSPPQPPFADPYGTYLEPIS